MKTKLLGVIAVLALLGLSPANAVPFTLDYSVTPAGANYQYNFSLVLDNNDSSWVAGQQFNWLVVGDGILIPIPRGAQVTQARSPRAQVSEAQVSLPASRQIRSTVLPSGHITDRLCASAGVVST